MSTAQSTSLNAEAGVLRRAENWMDAKGKAAWITAMVLGFILFWPIGLALLFYMIFAKKFGSKQCHGYFTNDGGITVKSSGNSAFDAYKSDTLRRLEEEQSNFEAFLERLRAAKDKAEFDEFIRERDAGQTAPTQTAQEEK